MAANQCGLGFDRKKSVIKFLVVENTNHVKLTEELAQKRMF